MPMDALTNAAIKSLAKDILPKLQDEIAAIMAKPENERQAGKSLTFLISECREMLDIMAKWACGTGPSDSCPSAVTTNENTEVEPDEGEMLMIQMAMDENDEISNHSAGEGADCMSDDEAIALLAQMDGKSAPTSPPKKAASMSDDEATALLAQMDGKPTAALKAQSAAPMSDDEATALLAQMDSPAAAINHEPPAVKETAAIPADNTPPAPTKVELVLSDDGADNQDFAVTEISEWEKNDFQTDPDMVGDFVTNTDEIMQTLDVQILELEKDPHSKEIIEGIFRAAHTLKGAGGMFGFRAIERVMHRMESLFDKIRKGKLEASSDIIDVVFKGLDVLRTLLQAVKDKRPCGIKTGEIVALLSMAAAGRIKLESKGAAIPQNTEAKKSDSSATGEGAKKDLQSSTIRVDLERLDSLVNLVGELVIDRTRFLSIEDELRTKYPNLKLSGSISETVLLFGRHMNEIQDTIMRVRMVPIGSTFAKYTRIVRDLAKSLDKKINLHISGENAELDKTLVELIADPLIHLIRNSCDHGVETPDVRIKNGKDGVGNIYLSAKQEGNSIIIQIKDDGKGIDPDIIRKKAIEKGLIKEDQVLSTRDIFNLIFEPGFSTAEKVTNVSGRGVGMDVVKKTITKLKGILDVNSAVNQGTTITIQLPLTLAIVQSLLVSIKGETFAIPLASVIESIRISADEIQKVGDNEVIKLRNRVLPLLHLDRVLNLESKKGSMAELIQQHNKKRQNANGTRVHKSSNKNKYFVVVVGQQDHPFGIVVDHLLNQQEMVIKSMGHMMRDIPALAGGAVLGNGEVVLVLDIMELQGNLLTKNRTFAA